MEAKDILNKYYGYDDFRPDQKIIIDEVVKNRDVLGILPTGGGKSICYQVPALLKDGLTLVVSPLISLMKDQVDSLNEIGIPTRAINSSLDLDKYKKTFEEVEKGEIKLLYIAPERLDSEYFISWINSLNIGMIAIDEAHCISQWGHEFRPSYRRIRTFIDSLRIRPQVLAFTATATKAIREDIVYQLGLKDPFIRIASFDRPNIKFSILEPADKDQKLLEILDKDESTIIYASTRKKVDELYEFLLNKDFKVGKYHAGMGADERDKEQEAFIKDKLSVIVATNAFGMGIDKPDVRKVIHYNMPKNMEAYYQEAGRAGRDGEKAQAILLFSKQDIVIQKFLIAKGAEPDSKVRLDKMIGYTRATRCLREYMLNYFEEELKEACGNCSNCTDELRQENITKEAQMILSCIYRMKLGFGSVLVADVLKGSKSKKVLNWDLDKISTYGIMAKYDKRRILDYISSLLADGFIKTNSHGGLLLTKKSKEILLDGKEYIINIRKTDEKKLKSSKFEGVQDTGLYEILRLYRNAVAQDLNLPPYVIFSNQVLANLANYKPLTLDELMQIPGIGENKTKKYGQDIIKLIHKYLDDNGIKRQGELLEARDLKAIAVKNKETVPSPTQTKTLDLYKQGLTAEEVARERELTLSTIYGHIYNLAKDFQLDFHSEEKSAYHDEVLKAIEEVGYMTLTPIKERINPEASFTDIRKDIIIYLVEKNKYKKLGK